MLSSESIHLIQEIQEEIQKLPLHEIGLIPEKSSHGGDSEGHLSQMVKKRIQSLSLPQRERVWEEFFGLGPIQKLMNDPAVSEIIFHGHKSICYEREGEMHLLKDTFMNDLNFHNFIRRVFKESGVCLSLEKPFANGVWRGFRLHASDASLSSRGLQLCLRRHPENPWTLDKLKKQNWASYEVCEQIRKRVQEKKNILVIGPTSSGKSSVLNALLQEVNEKERVVLIEDSSELKSPNDFSVKLFCRTSPWGTLPEVLMERLLCESMRMRPHRIVVGEVRGSEAKDLLLMLSTGHAGSMGTLHASDAQQCLLRLEMLVQMGMPQWSLASIRRLLYLSLDCILVVERNSKGQHRFKDLYEIRGVEAHGLLTEKVDFKPSMPVKATGQPLGICF